MSGNESAARSAREGRWGWRGRRENGPRKATKEIRAVKKQKVSESEEPNAKMQEEAQPSICIYTYGLRTEVHTSSKVEPLNKVERCTF